MERHGDACYTAGTEELLPARQPESQAAQEKEEAFVVAVMKEHVFPFSSPPLMFNYVRTSPFSHGKNGNVKKNKRKEKKKRKGLSWDPV